MLTRLTVQERIAKVREIGEEIVGDARLESLFTSKQNPVAYDGFEPSGRMHIAQGIVRSLNVNKLTESGCIFKFWVADWFALMNKKMDGNLEMIQKVGKYFVEVWRACGMNLKNVQFLWCSEEINNNSKVYWEKVIDLATNFTSTRMSKCCTIMGKEDKDVLQASQLLYPCMQATDVFFLETDICQLGLDQRKVNAIAIEYAKKIKVPEPIIVSHHMLIGLDGTKMSKSNPENAIFMEDTEVDIVRKINKAKCVEKLLQDNPIIEYLQYIVFPASKVLHVKRPTAEGGDITYNDIEVLKKDYEAGLLHPAVLKPAVAKAINTLVEPCRRHFEENEYARGLLNEINEFKKSLEKKNAEQTKQE